MKLLLYQKMGTAWVSLSLFFHASIFFQIIAITDAESTGLLKVGVPSKSFSDRFVSVNRSINNNPDENIYSGFCIDTFKEAVKNLSPPYKLLYKFIEFSGSYDDLISCVANKTFDAAVGDITILASRAMAVDFTTPYTVSGMWMIVPMKPQARNAWLFLKPFTTELWVATVAMLMYTFFVMWLLLFRFNQENCESGKDNFTKVLWFTFSSLLFAHKERIQHNYFSRLLVVVWLFVVLILTQCYTASLTSILTISRLDPDVDALKKSNAVVGCYGNNFVRDYLENAFHFKKGNIREDLTTQSHYLEAFESGDISAAFLEVPYAKTFVNQYCNRLAVSGPAFKSGGFGFVFQKGSPIADDVSSAILKIMEDGTLKNLEDEYFAPSSDCSNFRNAENIHSLTLQNLQGLFIVYLAISAICVLSFIISSLINRKTLPSHLRHLCTVVHHFLTHQSEEKETLPPSQFWSSNIADSRDHGRAPLISDHAVNYIVMR